jgi:hypothetical protein
LAQALQSVCGAEGDKTSRGTLWLDTELPP